MQETISSLRLVAIDLDGTLLDRKGRVSPRTRMAIDTAANCKNILIVPATGRPLASLPPEVAQLPGIRVVLTSNGAAVWDLGDDPLGAVYSRYADADRRKTSEPVCLIHDVMPTETARIAFDICYHFHANLRIFSNGRAYTDVAGQALRDRQLALKGSTEANQPNDGRFTIVRDFPEWMSRHAHEIEKLCVFFESAQQASAALPAFSSVQGIELVQGCPENIEITAAGVDKGAALLTLAASLGIAREQTLAIGDSENDRSMLEKAGHSAVMANGMPQIKAIADYVSCNSNDDDGVAELFNRLVL